MTPLPAAEVPPFPRTPLPGLGPLPLRRLLIARALFAVCALLALLSLIVWLLPLIGAAHDDLNAYIDAVYDDSYYYLTMATNLAQSGRSTMDGVTLTNGYQPLWQLLLTGLALTVGTDAVTLVQATCVLTAVLAAFGIATALIRHRDRDPTALLCAGVGVCYLVLMAGSTFLVGMETTLFLPLTVPLLLLLDRRRCPREDWQLSILLAAAFLIRLDALALAIAVVAVERMAPAGMRRLDRDSLVRLAGILLPTVLIYLLANWAIFGIPVPVSGLAKAVGGRLFSNWGVLAQVGGVWKPLLLGLIALATAEGMARGAGAPATFRRAIAVLLLAAIGQQLYYAAFSSWYLWNWYYYLQYLAIAAMIARISLLAIYLSASGRKQLPLAAAALWFVGALALVDARAVRQRWFPHPAGVTSTTDGTAELPQETASAANLRMLRAVFPKSDKRLLMVAMGDDAGALAFWGFDRLRVAQLEGLTLDADYIRARVAGRANAYFNHRYRFDYFAVDREYIPLVMGPEGQFQYAVAEPISGRTVLDRVPVFCFPESAVVYDQRYVDGGITFRHMAFRYSQHQLCSTESKAVIERARTGPGLRQFSLPEVYSLGYASAVGEQRDRNLWR